MSYLFLGNDGGKFTLDSATGCLKLTSVLDFESAPSYTINIQARDTDSAGNVKFAEFIVYVIVTDVNDNTPTFSQPQYSLDVLEDKAPNSTVMTLSAADPDGGNNGLVTYSIIGGNSSGVWDIDSSTGALVLKGRYSLHKYVDHRNHGMNQTFHSHNCL